MTGIPTLGSPLYQAEIDRGDRLLDIGGEAIASPRELAAYLENHEAGEVAAVRFESLGRTYETQMTLGTGAHARPGTRTSDGIHRRGARLPEKVAVGVGRAAPPAIAHAGIRIVMPEWLAVYGYCSSVGLAFAHPHEYTPRHEIISSALIDGYKTSYEV